MRGRGAPGLWWWSFELGVRWTDGIVHPSFEIKTPAAASSHPPSFHKSILTFPAPPVASEAASIMRSTCSVRMPSDARMLRTVRGRACSSALRLPSASAASRAAMAGPFSFSRYKKAA